MKSRYKFYADLIFVVHVLFIAYFVFGAFYSRNHPVFALYQSVLVIVTVFLPELIGGCPITLLEIYYRKRYDPNYKYRDNSFYSHYVFGKLLKIQLPKRGVDAVLLVTKVVPNFIPFVVAWQHFWPS